MEVKNEEFPIFNNEAGDPLGLASRKRMVFNTVETSTPVKKARVGFSMDEEITLLQLVLKINPYADQNRWPRILDLLHANIEDKTHVHSMRSVRDKVRNLTREFSASENQNKLRRSGTNEQYAERRALLASVIELQDKYRMPAACKTIHPRKENEFLLMEPASAIVSPLGNLEIDEKSAVRQNVPTAASNASNEPANDRETRAETRSVDFEARKLQIQERTLDLREKELQTVLKQQELLAKQQEILERTTVLFMKFIDKMTNSCEKRF